MTSVACGVLVVCCDIFYLLLWLPLLLSVYGSLEVPQTCNIQQFDIVMAGGGQTDRRHCFKSDNIPQN